MTLAPVVAGSTPNDAPRSWKLRPADEIVPGRRAVKLLGGGERYEAWVAWDERLHGLVVAKLLRHHHVSDGPARAAITAESDALSQLEHPVLVRSFGSVLEGNRPHLVLEFLDGPRLSTLIRKFGPLAAEQLVPLARQMVSAIHFMANEGWVHLDIKPRNIVMTSSPRLIDLSVARRIADARQIRGPVGTRAYMAPEQCDPARFSQIGPASDVWGLGATLFEALSGRQAFPATSQSAFPQLHEPVPEISRKAPAALATAIRASLEKDAGARPTAGELDELLESIGDWSGRAVRRLR